MQRTAPSEQAEISSKMHRGENIGQNPAPSDSPLGGTETNQLDSGLWSAEGFHLPLSFSLSQPQCGWSAGPISGWNTVSILINPDVDINKMKAGLD